MSHCQHNGKDYSPLCINSHNKLCGFQKCKKYNYFDREHKVQVAGVISLKLWAAL